MRSRIRLPAVEEHPTEQDLEDWFDQAAEKCKDHGLWPGRVPGLRQKYGTAKMMAMCVMDPFNQYDLDRMKRLGMTDCTFEWGVWRFQKLPRFQEFPDAIPIAKWKIENPDWSRGLGQGGGKTLSGIADHFGGGIHS